ncbi:MAG: nucleoside 2-deoxyribosyltransferase domain-containing protein [Candidatus Uhrbacteria bacterium]
MRTVYAGETFPTTITKILYLAGPSPRDKSHPNWREETLRRLEQEGYDGHVFVPLPRDGQFPDDYQAQATWEQSAMDRSDVVLFWVPRNLVTLPAFTTNVEFGQKCRNRNVVLGYPKGAPKCRFLGYLAERNFIDHTETLEQTIKLALDKIGVGAERHGGECEVPLYLWRTPHFQSWLQAQKSAGNRLDGCSVELTLGVGPKKAFLFY